MNFLNILVVAFCVAQVFGSLPERIVANKNVELWKKWKQIHEKSYDRAVDEINRFNIWSENLQKVKDHNAAYDLGLKTFKVGMNAFADLTNEEFISTRLGYVRQSSVEIDASVHNAVGSAPDTQDWRTQGYVTGVKNQGQCGSCWAFGSTGGLEGQHFNATGKLVSLSEQELVDCDHNGDYGCNGGLPQNAYHYWMQEGQGARYESDYPYTARDGTCQKEGKPIAATLSSVHYVQRGSEAALKEAVGTIGPVPIGIDASNWSFQLYHSGVYYESACSQTALDHAVLVVGYNTDPSQGDYWIVKNSWGTGYGLNGYIWMARNRNNNCGIATDAVYPLV